MKFRESDSKLIAPSFIKLVSGRQRLLGIPVRLIISRVFQSDTHRNAHRPTTYKIEINQPAKCSRVLSYTVNDADRLVSLIRKICFITRTCAEYAANLARSGEVNEHFFPLPPLKTNIKRSLAIHTTHTYVSGYRNLVLLSCDRWSGEFVAAKAKGQGASGRKVFFATLPLGIKGMFSKQIKPRDGWGVGSVYFNQRLLFFSASAPSFVYLIDDRRFIRFRNLLTPVIFCVKWKVKKGRTRVCFYYPVKINLFYSP